MGQPFPFATTNLDYPPYALDFDPEDANRLAVSGGGGPGHTGVGNKITILDASTHEQLRVSGELEFSRDEDSIMTLAFGRRKGRTAYLYAGANSSAVSVAKGTNQHLRTIGLEQSRSRASVGTKIPGAKLSELSRTALFQHTDGEVFQRLLRVSGPLGVAASGLAGTAELAVFDAVGASPKIRGVLDLPRDAEDLDIVQTGEDSFQVAFCFKDQLWVVDVDKQVGEPRLVYDMPDDHGERPAFRFVRYISPDFIMAVSNLPNSSGAVLQGLRLPKSLNNNEKTRLAITARIPRKIRASGFSIANLAPPASSTAPIGDTQFLVAVGANDSSISIYTLEHLTATKVNLLSNLNLLHILKDVHGTQNVSAVAFSRFVTPKTHIRPQFIKLASLSIQQTVAVHNIALTKFIDKTPRNRKGPPRPVRYVVAMKSKGQRPPFFAIFTVIFLLLAMASQAVFEMLGTSPPILHVHKILPSWYGSLRHPDHQPAVFLADEFVSKLSGGKTRIPGETLVVWEDDKPAPTAAEMVADEAEAANRDLRMDVHDVEVHGPGMTWDDLADTQKQLWKERLQTAGAWTEGMGESVFRGILFGEIAGAVGRAVGG